MIKLGTALFMVAAIGFKMTDESAERQWVKFDKKAEIK